MVSSAHTHTLFPPFSPSLISRTVLWTLTPCLLTAVIGELKGDNLRVVRQQKSYYWSAKDCFVAGVSFRASFELIEGREGTVRSDGERKEEISSTEMPCAAETERKQKLT